MTHVFLVLLVLVIVFALGTLFGGFVFRKNPEKSEAVLTEAEKLENEIQAKVK